MASTYTTKSGDTWDRVARNVFGSEYRADELMAANPEHIGTFAFSAGEVLKVQEPKKETDGKQPPWKYEADL